MTKGVSKIARTIAVRKYLDALDAGETGSYSVPIRSLAKGQPKRSTDPDEIGKAIEQLRKRAEKETGTKRLLTLQAAVDLDDGLAELLAMNGSSPLDGFIEHGAQWAIDNGVSYRAFSSGGSAGVGATGSRHRVGDSP